MTYRACCIRVTDGMTAYAVGLIAPGLSRDSAINKKLPVPPTSLTSKLAQMLPSTVADTLYINEVHSCFVRFSEESRRLHAVDGSNFKNYKILYVTTSPEPWTRGACRTWNPPVGHVPTVLHNDVGRFAWCVQAATWSLFGRNIVKVELNHNLQPFRKKTIHEAGRGRLEIHTLPGARRE